MCEDVRVLDGVVIAVRRHVWETQRFAAQAGLDPLAPPSPGGLQVRLETPQQIDALRAALLHFSYGTPAA